MNVASKNSSPVRTLTYSAACLALALVLPLCGAHKKREPFAGLLWLPLTAFIVAVQSQYLALIGINVPVPDMLRTGDSNVILVECSFIGFLLVTMIRTRK